jgi:hypothetical protein
MATANPDPTDRAEPLDPERLASALMVLAEEISAHGLKGQASCCRVLGDGLNRNDEALTFCDPVAWAMTLRERAAR